MECIDHGKRGGRNGYLTVRNNGKVDRAHRLAYCFTRGIPIEYIKGFIVRHTCDNPRCINPRHLILGTHQDNMDDMRLRGRQAKGEQQGLVKLTEADVLFIRDNYVRYSKEYSTVGLARKFSVNQATISRILTRELWAHI